MYYVIQGNNDLSTICGITLFVLACNAVFKKILIMLQKLMQQSIFRSSIEKKCHVIFLNFLHLNFLNCVSISCCNNN